MTGNNANVDVGMPAYKRPDYIVEAIESVLAQTFESWTMTISEDGVASSTIYELVEPYLSDTRIRYVGRPERQGQSANWNWLVRAGEAPYVALLHDDDRWAPEFLERRVAFFEAHPECGVVFSRTREIDESGRTIGHRGYGFAEGVIPPDDLLRKLVYRNAIGHPSSVVVRRSAYEQAKAEFRKVIYEDYDVWFRLALHVPFGFLDVCDADYRVHLDSMTFEEQDVRKRYLELMEELVAAAQRERPGVLSWRQERQPRSELALAIALDELQAGRRRDAARYVLRAVRTYPPAVADRRTLAWAVATPLGQTGRNLVASSRSRARATRSASRPEDAAGT